MPEPRMSAPENKEFEEKVIQIARVSKKTKGGNQFGFAVLMVVGDKKGKVGLGLGKAKDVLSAIKKGVKKAKRRMILIPLDGTTLPFKMEVKLGAGRVLVKPAPKGTGVIAGGPVRAIMEAAGVRDVSAKILGSDNQASSAYAAFEALIKMKRLVEVRGIKLRSIVDIEREEKEKMKKLQEKAKTQGEEGKASADEAKAKSAKQAKPAEKVGKPAAKPAKPKTEKAK